MPDKEIRLPKNDYYDGQRMKRSAYEGPYIDTNAPGSDRQMSGVLRKWRTMGPGRQGNDASAQMVTDMLMGTPPAEGSSLPSGMSAEAASKLVSDMRMKALMDVLRYASKPSGME